jgi:hypothetical protein
MAAELIASLGIFKSLYDSAKALKEMIELQEKILAARESQTTLIERISELEKEVTALKDWEADKKRYQLTDIGKGVVALALKPSVSNGEPPHCICADCAANGKKSYLQLHISGPHYDQYKCNGCGFEVGIDKGNPPESQWQSIDDEDSGGGFMTA